MFSSLHILESKTAAICWKSKNNDLHMPFALMPLFILLCIMMSHILFGSMLLLCL